MRSLVLWCGLAATLAAANWAIIDKERVLSNGQTMLLQLAPRDPRSLLQGDYMTLQYSLAREIAEGLGESFTADGAVVVTLDQNDVARFSRFAQRGESLSAGERLLRYRKRGENLRLAGDAYFFEEGQQSVYADARYGELVVDRSGEPVLVGLRDANFGRLGPSPR